MSPRQPQKVRLWKTGCAAPCAPTRYVVMARECRCRMSVHTVLRNSRACDTTISVLGHLRSEEGQAQQMWSLFAVRAVLLRHSPTGAAGATRRTPLCPAHAAWAAGRSLEQVILQPQHGVQVQMVGGLVQQQQVCMGAEQSDLFWQDGMKHGPPGARASVGTLKTCPAAATPLCGQRASWKSTSQGKLQAIQSHLVLQTARGPGPHACASRR